MHNPHNTVGVPDRAQKSEAPATVQPVTRAKYTKTKSILKHAKSALLAIFLSPTYQIAIAGAATVGIILMGGRA
jgi:hypothetical protein